MASLLCETLFEINGQSPAPSKDFFQLVITKNCVIWRWWKISLRSKFRNTRPGEVKESHTEFLQDSSLQTQVSRVFGASTLQYSLSLCKGHFDYLERLPDPLLLHIMAFLELEDVLQLRCTSQRFRQVQLCDSNQFWEQRARGCCKTLTADLESLADVLGWKEVFFSNKLQLQKRIRRRRLMQNKAGAAEAGGSAESGASGALA